MSLFASDHICNVVVVHLVSLEASAPTKKIPMLVLHSYKLDENFMGLVSNTTYVLLSIAWYLNELLCLKL